MLPESPQTFEVTAARTSGLVNLVFLLFFFFCQTGFSNVNILLLINL